MSGLEERLERLEQRNEALEVQNRRWKRAGLGAFAAVGVALMMGQAARDRNGEKAKFDHIEAREITLVDQAGKARLQLGLDDDGVGLDVLDANGKVRLELGIDKDGAGFEIRDADGKVRVAIGEGKGGGHGAGAWVLDEKERPRVGLGIGMHGTGLIVLDESGKPIAGEGKAAK